MDTINIIGRPDNQRRAPVGVVRRHDGVGVVGRFDGPAAAAAAPRRHHELRQAAGPKNRAAQRDPGARGAVPGHPVRPAPHRRAPLPAARAAPVLAGHPQRHAVRPRLPPVPGGPLPAQRHAARLVHGQPGHGGHLRPGPERGLPLPQHLRAH